jgi:hypothetical protein
MRAFALIFALIAAGRSGEAAGSRPVQPAARAG